MARVRVSMQPVYDALKTFKKHRPHKYREFVKEVAGEYGARVYGDTVEQSAYVLMIQMQSKLKCSREEAIETMLGLIQKRTGILFLLAELGG